jgi:hypothetical protein
MTEIAHDAFIVGGRAVAAPAELRVLNFHDEGVLHFEGRARDAQSVSEIIVHESVTRSADATARVLERRRLGVHLIVAPDGVVHQHGDLATARLAHAGGHNGPSIGIEVVNPYYPFLVRDGLPWQRNIAARWAHKDRYVLPTPAQAEATAALLRWLTSAEAIGLRVPRTWVGVRDGALAMGRLRGASERRPGVYAHHYFGHADGAWPVLYAWLRLEAGLPPAAAYEEAARRASGARRSIPLHDLIAATPVA